MDYGTQGRRGDRFRHKGCHWRVRIIQPCRHSCIDDAVVDLNHIKHRQFSCLPAADLFRVDQWVGNFFITADRKLVGAIELGGIDPSSFGFSDHLKLSKIIDVIFSNIPPAITVTQYQINSRAGRIKLKSRDDPFQHRMSQQREAFLSAKPFLTTKLIEFFEIDLDDSFNSLNPFSIVSIAIGSLSDKTKRKALLNSLSAKQQLYVSRKDITEKSEILKTALNDVITRWQAFSDARVLSRPEIDRVLVQLASFRSETSPVSDCDEAPVGQFLADGDIKPVTLAGQAAIKFDGAEPVYARVAAVVSFGKRAVPGFWAHDSASPSELNFEFVLMYRWRRMTNTQSTFMFELKRKELERETLSFESLVTNKRSDGTLHLSKKLRDKFAELDDAGAMKVTWHRSEAYVLTHSSDADSLKAQVKKLHAAVTNSGAKLVWEDANLMNAYRAFYPTGAGKGARSLITNNPQNAAYALCYKSSIGIPLVEHTNEEALCVFQSPSGVPFWYYPSVGGRGLVLGIGPSRTGKTYFKNTVALHSLKYGGTYYALDVDPGTEPLANTMGHHGSVFRVYDESRPGGGFNLFKSCRGPNDQTFKAHFLQQIKRMIKTNLDETSRALTLAEQQELDAALTATLNLPKEMQNFSFFFSHLNKSLGNKLSRWVRADSGQRREAGLYSQLTDCVVDAISEEARFNVFNFQNLKNDVDQRSVAYAEVFHRIVREFESPQLRAVPKFLDIDECHIPLQDLEFQHWITQGVVTWNKFHVFPSLWTQSVEEMLKLERWEAIRSAAGTMLFTADHSLNEQLYMQALGVTMGECQAIKSLIPRKQIYIIQRDIGVSKAIEINNDQFTDVVISSTPSVVALRDNLIAQHGIEQGIVLTLQALYP